MTMPKDPQKALAYRKKLSEKAKGRKFTEDHKINLIKARRLYISQRGTTEWYRINKDGKKIKDWNEACKIKRTQELEKRAGRPKPKNCEVCGTNGRICFDHSHKTNKFRGWICEHCNVLLGFAKDDITKLELLVKYLKTHNSSTLRD